MQKFRRTLAICGALTLAATAWRCDSNGSSGSNPDLSGPTADMAGGGGGGDMAASTAPTITSIKPGTGTNAGGTSITITGTGFQQNATVTIAGAACTQVVVAADGNSLTCTTPAKAKTCGAVATVVTNPDNQSASSNAFAYTSKQFGFGTAANVANNNLASRFAVWADFDLDGKNDIANLNGTAANPGNNVSVQLGKGDGTFQTTVGTDLGAGNAGAALAAGDMNNEKVGVEREAPFVVPRRGEGHANRRLRCGTMFT
jgi:hypothetical protein